MPFGKIIDSVEYYHRYIGLIKEIKMEIWNIRGLFNEEVPRGFAE